MVQMNPNHKLMIMTLTVKCLLFPLSTQTQEINKDEEQQMEWSKSVTKMDTHFQYL